jgi:signal peptidase II
MRRLFLVLAIIGITLGLDQYTKSWAIAELQHMPTRSYLGGTFLLLYAENTGAWGSMGSDLSETARFWLLTILPIGFLAGLSWYVITSNELKPYMVICYALVIGGGAGNLIDRAVHGYVVDFLWTGIPDSIGTNIYNLADVFIMIGVITLLVMHLLYERHEPQPQKN